MEKLTADTLLLLNLARINHSEQDYYDINNLLLSIDDWNNFYTLTISHGIGSFLYKRFLFKKKPEVIPSEIIAKFSKIYYRSLGRNMVLYEYFQNILQLFSINNIAVIPLKGIFMAETLYEDIGLRQMSDIDLLVRKEHIEKCLQILSEMGFVVAGRHKTSFIKNKGVDKHLPTMVLNDIFVEIHYRILVDNTTHSVDIDEYWKNATPVKLFNTDTLALSPENLLQYLCIHLERHFNEGKIQLYQFTDLLILLEKYQHTINWEYFIKSCIQNNCTNNVSKILFLLNRFFSASFPENLLQLISSKVDISAENLFVHFLNCDAKSIQQVTGVMNIRVLKKVKGSRNRIRFLLGDLFPSRDFMKARYQIKSNHLLFFYYIKRFIKGMAILTRHLFFSRD